MINVNGSHVLAMERKLPGEKSVTATRIQSVAAKRRNRTQHDVVIVDVVVPGSGAHQSARRYGSVISPPITSVSPPGRLAFTNMPPFSPLFMGRTVTVILSPAFKVVRVHPRRAR